MELNIKKILVDAHVFDHSFQGTSTYILGLYSHLVENKNLEITLCARNIDNLKLHFKDKRFKFLQLSSDSKIVRLFKEFPKIIQDGSYDYAHFQYIVPFRRSENCKYINTLHDLLFLDYPEHFPLVYRLIRKFLFKNSTRRSDYIFTVSQYSRLQIQKYFKIPQTNVYLSPNGVTQHVFDNPAAEILDTKYILFVGRFEPRKNHLGLLKAFIEGDLHKMGYKLIFIGSKKEAIELEAYNKVVANIPKALKDSVVFYEGLSNEKLYSYYKNAACFVFPCFAEGFGIPPIEAAINDTKVVCSSLTAMRDFDFFKYQFNPHNQEEFNKTLLAALQDDAYPFKETKNAVIKNYNWVSIANNFYLDITRDM
jgi:glycosyltransferase involved in cell wall biosynthesis